MLYAHVEKLGKGSNALCKKAQTAMFMPGQFAPSWHELHTCWVYSGSIVGL